MSSRSIGEEYDRLVRHRGFLLWLQLGLALAVCLVFLSTLNLSHFTYWGRRAGVAALLLGAAPMIPYLISAGLSRRVITSSRPRVWLFVATLLVGTAIVSYIYITGQNHTYGTITIVTAQTLVYAMAVGTIWRDVPNVP
jgi:hypothetical protein